MLSELLQNPNILKIGRDTHTFSSIQIVAHVLLVMDRLLPWAILAKSDKMLVILYSSNMLWWFWYCGRDEKRSKCDGVSPPAPEFPSTAHPFVAILASSHTCMHVCSSSHPQTPSSMSSRSVWDHSPSSYMVSVYRVISVLSLGYAWGELSYHCVRLPWCASVLFLQRFVFAPRVWVVSRFVLFYLVLYSSLSVLSQAMLLTVISRS